MRFISGCLLLGLIIFPSNIAAENSYELTFVASVEELNSALKKRETLRGLAVRSEFYDASDSKIKAKIDDLVENIRNQLRPIFIYGFNLRLELFEKWFYSEERKESVVKAVYFKCKATLAGVFSTVPINKKSADAVTDAAGGWTGANFLMCGSYDGAKSENDFRNYIDSYWREVKQSLKDEGWATLN